MKTNKFIIALICACVAIFSTDAFARGGDGNRGGSRASKSTTTTTTTTRRTTSTSVTPANRNSSSNLSPKPETRGHVQTGTNNKNLPPSRVAPSANYKKMPPRGAVVSKNKAVKHAHPIKHGGHDYYYKKGVFYHYNAGKYVVTRPPVGIRVSVIPTPRVVWVNNVRYYYYYGTFYNHISVTNEYEVVKPPVGAIVESIPEGYEKLEIDGNTYYIVDGVQYKAVVYEGEIWYEVIKVD